LRSLWKAVRYSSIGVFFTGIVTVIQGCDAREAGLAAVLLFLLQFCTGPISDDAGEENRDLGCVKATDSCTLYAIDKIGGDDLYRLNPADGSTLVTLTLTLAGGDAGGATGLAAHPLTNELWALVRTNSPSTDRGLAKVDPATGAITVVGNTGLKLAALAIDGNGVFFAVSGDCIASVSCTPEVLYQLDPNTGAPTQLCTLGNGDDGEALAYNPFDGFIYHGSGNSNDVFERIDDPSTCTVTDIPLSGDSIIEFRGLTFNPATGLFLLADGIDLSSLTLGGVNTILGNTSGLKGLAFLRN
jgi:hypothetical protein